jgi:hypothetical protein
VDVATVFHDGTGPEEANAGDDIGDDLSRSRSDRQSQVDECGCSEADEGIGPEAGGSLSPLTLCADAGTKNESQQKVGEAWLMDQGDRISPPMEPGIGHMFSSRGDGFEELPGESPGSPK